MIPAVRPAPVVPAAARTGRRRRPNLSPASEALAFRIWQVADPTGWNLTLNDLATRLEEPRQRIVWVCGAKGWTSRLRVTVTDQTLPHLGRLPHFEGGHGVTILPDFDEGLA